MISTKEKNLKYVIRHNEGAPVISVLVVPLQMSPLTNSLPSGIPWHITSFTDLCGCICVWEGVVCVGVWGGGCVCGVWERCMSRKHTGTA